MNADPDTDPDPGRYFSSKKSFKVFFIFNIVYVKIYVFISWKIAKNLCGFSIVVINVFLENLNQDPDPHSYCGSRSSNLLNTDPMWIQRQNPALRTEYSAMRPTGPVRHSSHTSTWNKKRWEGSELGRFWQDSVVWNLCCEYETIHFRSGSGSYLAGHNWSGSYLAGHFGSGSYFLGFLRSGSLSVKFSWNGRI